jgi:hypothetical protein
MKMKNYFMAFLLILVMSACSDGDDSEIICTEEFRIIGVKVSGGALSDYYTIRTSTADTIRFAGDQGYPIGNWYPVLDDSFQVLLEGTEEEFSFAGEVDGSRVVNAIFIIGADVCHVYKKSGPAEISFSP